MRVLTLALAAAAIATTAAVPATGFTPGAATAGDSYLPVAGDGGYDASHYTLDLDYLPRTGQLTATSTMAALATQNLSRFDLDLRGLTVSRVTVDGVAAAFSRHGRKLVITPRTGLRAATTFSVTVTYHGIPAPAENGPLGTYGWVRTPDGAVVVAQPDGASTWFPSMTRRGTRRRTTSPSRSPPAWPRSRTASAPTSGSPAPPRPRTSWRIARWPPTWRRW